MKNRLLSLGVALLLLVGLSACGSYYRVTDPTTGSTYYTNDLKKQKGVAVKLTDSNTGSTVTLQTSEVAEINKEEYKSNTKKE